MIKMDRTNNPNPIASIGRTNFKKVISAILLLSLLLFSLLAGANSLQAQERKTGWFVGISPYAMDLNLKKTTRQKSEVFLGLLGLLYTMLLCLTLL